jgi:hypothetical protein
MLDEGTYSTQFLEPCAAIDLGPLECSSVKEPGTFRYSDPSGELFERLRL